MGAVKIMHTVEELATPINGYKYNVKEEISLDGGKTYIYAGNGRFFKTLNEAIDYVIEEASK